MAATPASRKQGRPPGPSLKGAATRRHVIDSAATVFAELGYDRARMSQLVEATGMTKGAVYFHFDSKEALALAVLEIKHQEWVAQVTERLAPIPPGRSRLQALLPVMLDLHSTDPSTWAISKLTQNLAELPATRPDVARLTRRWIELVAEVIRDAQELGECRPDSDPVATATVLVGAFDGIKAIHDAANTPDGPAFATTAEVFSTIVLGHLLR